MSRYRPAPEPWTRVAIGVVRATAVVANRPDYRGRAHLGGAGLILAVNHLSNLDPVLIARYVLAAGRIPRFLAKAELLDSPLIGRPLRGAGQIPVYRGADDAAAALIAAEQALQRGELVVVYPEGTFTTDPEGWPMLARTGLARLAIDTRAPIVPVAQWGIRPAMVGNAVAGGRWRPRRLLSVLAGPPIELGAGVRSDPAGLRAVTDAVMFRLRDQLAELRGISAPSRIWDPAAGARVATSHLRTDVVERRSA